MVEFYSSPNDVLLMLKNFQHLFGYDVLKRVCKVKVQAGDNQVVVHMCVMCFTIEWDRCLAASSNYNKAQDTRFYQFCFDFFANE